MDSVIINLIATTGDVVAQLALAVLLTYAGIRNHLRGKFRPLVWSLAIYFGVAVVLSGLRLVTRVYVLEGGDSTELVNGAAYTTVIFIKTLATWGLYRTLIRAYPDAKERRKRPRLDIYRREGTD